MKTVMTTQLVMAALCVVTACLVIAATTAPAADDEASVARTPTTNARIFDGKSETLTDNVSLLVEGDKIVKIAPSITAPKGATVRDAAGSAFSLRFAIDREYVVGPRICPSGPLISQTAGHADHRRYSDASALAGGTWDPMVRYGDMAVVDAVPEVPKAAREALRMGASQIKIAVGGDAGSHADPLEVTEFTPEQI